jgi:hypothetical protein
MLADLTPVAVGRAAGERGRFSHGFFSVTEPLQLAMNFAISAARFGPIMQSVRSDGHRSAAKVNSRLFPGYAFNSRFRSREIPGYRTGNFLVSI